MISYTSDKFLSQQTTFNTFMHCITFHSISNAYMCYPANSRCISGRHFSPSEGREATTGNTSAVRRLHPCQMNAKTISLFDICFKIENRASTQRNFQKTDTQKLLCVFLSSFSVKDYLKTM